MKIAKTRLRPAPRQLELDVHFAVSPVGLPNAEQFAHWVAAALRCGPRVAQIGLRVVDEAEGRELNHTWRQKDYATNVLSFPADVPEGLLDIPLRHILPHSLYGGYEGHADDVDCHEEHEEGDDSRNVSLEDEPAESTGLSLNDAANLHCACQDNGCDKAKCK